MTARQITLAVPTDAVLSIAETTGECDGQALAKILRMAADQAESDVQMLAADRDIARVPETHRFAARIDGVLVGVVMKIGSVS